MAISGKIGSWFVHVRRILATLCIGVLAALIAYKVVFGANGTIEWRAKRGEYLRLQQDIEKATIEHQELEKLGFVMPGEVVLVQPQPKSDVRTDSAEAENLNSPAAKKK